MENNQQEQYHSHKVIKNQESGEKKPLTEYEMLKAQMQKMKSEMTIKEAVKVLCKALREDPEYYYGWQANIAMAYKDETKSSPEAGKTLPIGTIVMSWEECHEVANKAAKRFLNTLIHQPSKEQ